MTLCPKLYSDQDKAWFGSRRGWVQDEGGFNTGVGSRRGRVQDEARFKTRLGSRRGRVQKVAGPKMRLRSRRGPVLDKAGFHTRPGQGEAEFKTRPG